MSPHKIILFDGDCNLCNHSVQLVIRKDPSQKFLFAAIQSEVGKKILSQHGVDQPKLTTFYYLDQTNLMSESEAALQVAKQLNFPYYCFSIFLLLPKPLRDSCYHFIAKYRYIFFGKAKSCWLPSEELSKRFLS